MYWKGKAFCNTGCTNTKWTFYATVSSNWCSWKDKKYNFYVYTTFFEKLVAYFITIGFSMQNSNQTCVPQMVRIVISNSYLKDYPLILGTGSAIFTGSTNCVPISEWILMPENTVKVKCFFTFLILRILRVFGNTITNFSCCRIFLKL